MNARSALLRSLGPVFLGATALLITASLLPARFSRIVIVDDKLASLEAAETPFDVVILGSSRIARRVSPDIFDRRLWKQGHQLRSFNAGISAMRIVESSALLTRIVENPKTRPRWILMEASGFFERIDRQQLTNPRTLYWHNMGSSLLAAQSVQMATLDRNGRMAHASRHIQAGIFHALNIGTWSSRMARWLGSPKSFGPKPVADRGFVAIPSREKDWSPSQARRRKAFVNRRDNYDSRIANYERAAAEAEPLTGFVPDVLRHAKETASRHGVELVFLLAPQSIGGPRVVLTIEREGLGPVLDFSNPGRYPKLFARNNRFDLEHLNERGSRLFSAYLATAFGKLIDDRQTGP